MESIPSSGQRVASQRPIHIALVTLGERLPFQVDEFARELGKIRGQNLFSFHVISSIVTDEELGLYSIALKKLRQSRRLCRAGSHGIRELDLAIVDRGG